MLAVVTALAASTHAHAAPSPAEIEAQLDAKFQELEPVIEQYNGVVAGLNDSKAKAAALQKQMEPLQQQVDAAMSKIGAFAVRAYKSGPITSASVMLASSSAEGLGGNLAQIEAIARRQRASVSAAMTSRDQYAKDKRALESLIAEQSAKEAELSAKRKDIEAKIADLQKLRTQAYGTKGSSSVVKPDNCPAEAGPEPGMTAARVACAQVDLHRMYEYGAEGPITFDCSGLTKFAWKAAGRSLTHQSKEQYNATRRVSRGELQVGDLVFYYKGISHVGIYVGKGWMVHASRPGEPVQMKSIDSGTAPIGYGRVK